MRTLAERLISSREAKGWKKADLRRAAGIKSASTLTELENGSRTESPQLAVIAEALGVETIWLQHGRGPRQRPSGPEKRMATEPLTTLFTPEERLLIDGFRVADPVTKKHILWMAEDSLASFGKRTGEQHREPGCA